MAVNTTTTLSNEMMIYLSRKFLELFRERIVFGEGAEKRQIPMNSGKTIEFARYNRLATASRLLTEGVNPSETNITGAKVSATLSEYGAFDKISSLLSQTSIDADAKQKIEVMAQDGAESIDTAIRDELFAGATVQFANGKAALSNLAATDVLTGTEVKKAVRALKKARALTYEDGYFLGKVGPDTSFDLMSDATWIAAHTYKDTKQLYLGELGSLYGVRFLEATGNQKNESSTTTVYSNFIHGKGAFGTVDLGKSKPQIYHKVADKNDTSNPLNMFETVGWKATFAAKTLTPTWVINIKTGATA